MKRGKRKLKTGFGVWIKAKVQRKGSKARIQLKKDGEWIMLNEFPKNLSEGLLSIQYIEEKRKVNAWKPLRGVFTFMTEKFACREGQAPTPKSGKDSWDNDIYTFVAGLEIFDEEKYKGCTFPYTLRCNFEPITIERNGKKVQALGTYGTGKPTQQLEEYLQVSDIWDRDFPYQSSPAGGSVP